LSEDPGLLRAIALKARLRAHLGQIMVGDAKREIQALIDSDPLDWYLHLQAAAVLGPKQSPKDTIPALREVAEAFDEAPVHQALAGALGCDLSLWPEAWRHYRIALRDGVLSSTRVKIAAYYLASRLEPSQKSAVLSGSSTIERMVVRTRSFGLAKLVLLYSLGVAAGFAAFLDGSIGLSATIWGVSTALALWVSYSNSYIHCWKCTVAWLGFPVLPWAFFGLAVASSHLQYIAGGALAGWVIGSLARSIPSIFKSRRLRAKVPKA
jgi:hypothetical protein